MTFKLGDISEFLQKATVRCTCGGTIRCHSDPDGEDEGRPWACDDCGRDVS